MSGTVPNSPSSLPRATSVALSDIVLVDQANGDGTYTTRGAPLALAAPAFAAAIAVAAGTFNGAILAAFLESLPTTAPAQIGWWNDNGVPTYGQAGTAPVGSGRSLNFSAASNSQNLSYLF